MNVFFNLGQLRKFFNYLCINYWNVEYNRVRCIFYVVCEVCKRNGIFFGKMQCFYFE